MFKATRLGVNGLTIAAFCVPGPTPARAQPVEWTQRVVTGPAPRQNHAMAYDAARGLSVLFGGSTASGFPNVETWEWNGTGGGGGGAWALRATTGPSARLRHAMAYDSARGVTVFFGGQINGGSATGDTWEWNGIAWTNRIVSGPSARYSHAMAYDAARGVTVLFGGGVQAISNGETWEWNGTGSGTWTNRMVVGPTPRQQHKMAYDSARGVTVLFGGLSGLTTYNGDTWEWNGTAWTNRMVVGPTPRSTHAMAYDAARGVTVLFGGVNNSGQNGETWEWNGTGGGVWVQRSIIGPTLRSAHAMAYDAARGFTVLFGGSVPLGPNGETWELGVGGCPGRKGDFDNNGVVTPADIPDFINNLLNGPVGATAVCKTDMNGDTLCNGRDIATFVECVTGGACP